MTNIAPKMKLDNSPTPPVELIGRCKRFLICLLYTSVFPVLLLIQLLQRLLFFLSPLSFSQFEVRNGLQIPAIPSSLPVSYTHLIPTLFNGCGFGPPLPLTAASTWTWIGHPVSGLHLRT